MKFTKYFLFGFIIWASTAQADFICKAKTQFGTDMVVTVLEKRGIGFNEARVEVFDAKKLVFKQEFKNLEDVWDSHMTGLITTRGFALKYESHFGVIRNVQIITDTRGPSGTSTIGFIDTLESPKCENL